MSAPSEALRAVLIDLDGTLMDTAPDIALAANRMRESFGLAPLPVARVASFVGKGADVLVHRALTDTLDGEVDEATFARGRTEFFRQYHAVNGDAAVLFDGARTALAALRDAGLRVACVTNKARKRRTAGRDAASSRARRRRQPRRRRRRRLPCARAAAP